MMPEDACAKAINHTPPLWDSVSHTCAKYTKPPKLMHQPVYVQSLARPRQKHLADNSPTSSLPSTRRGNKHTPTQQQWAQNNERKWDIKEEKRKREKEKDALKQKNDQEG